MADPTLPADLAQTVRDLQVRLDRLERQSVVPFVNLPVNPTLGQSGSTTAGVFDNTHTMTMGFVAQTAVRVGYTVSVPFGGTGETRLYFALSDIDTNETLETFTTNAVPVAFNPTLTKVVFDWAPGWTTGEPNLTGFIWIQARVTAGPSIQVNAPFCAYTASAPAISATPTGL